MESPERLSRAAAEFRESLKLMDWSAAIKCALSALDDGVNIVPLYEQVLAPALNEMTDGSQGETAWIWKEHVRSSILRATVEACFPYVMAERDLLGQASADARFSRGKVVLCCPSEELHDLGARMGKDFFWLAGYEPIFVGANTPDKTILEGLSFEKPDITVIHVVNPYHVFRVKNLIPEILNVCPTTRILVSGGAFRTHESLAAEIGASGTVNSYVDILALETSASNQADRTGQGDGESI